jgi:acyl dehydratase
MTGNVLTFEGFKAGAVMGSASERVEQPLLDNWLQLYPWDVPAAGEAPAGMSTVLLMRAYMRILTPRPPGNIHARQKIDFVAPARLGEDVTTEIACTGKELRKERRYVELATRSTGDGGRELFRGAMTLIWAA